MGIFFSMGRTDYDQQDNPTVGSKRQILEENGISKIPGDSSSAYERSHNKKPRISPMHQGLHEWTSMQRNVSASNFTRDFGNDHSNLDPDPVSKSSSHVPETEVSSDFLGDVIYVRKSLLSPEQLQIAAATEQAIKASNTLRTLRNKASPVNSPTLSANAANSSVFDLSSPSRPQ
jgi:hypothetical protein